jgi:hypothetical protein
MPRRSKRAIEQAIDASRESSEAAASFLTLRHFITNGSDVFSPERAAAPAPAPDLRVIGLGTCGTVFELPGTNRAYKKGGETADIWRDYHLTNTVHHATIRVSRLLQGKCPEYRLPCTPHCHAFYLPLDASFWTPSMSTFPAQHQQKQAAFEVDRILPLPQLQREALINLFFGKSDKARLAARENPDNHDCLVRVYLGEDEPEQQKYTPYTSLRNFPMYLNIFRALCDGQETELKRLAREMAAGLAVMHWEAQVDAMDVEFVLGLSSSQQDTGRALSKSLFMFDFDKARPTQLTPRHTKRLVSAYLGNDPYYPRPDGGDVWIWFCDAYMVASMVILENKQSAKVHAKRRKQRERIEAELDEQRAKADAILGLPSMFLNEVVRLWREKHENFDLEIDIAFDKGLLKRS